MDFNQLIADFAKRHNVENLVAVDGAAALDIDGIIVTIVAKGDLLNFSAEIGEPPVDGAAVFTNLLLEANVQPEAFLRAEQENLITKPCLTQCGEQVIERHLFVPVGKERVKVADNEVANGINFSRREITCAAEELRFGFERQLHGVPVVRLLGNTPLDADGNRVNMVFTGDK